MSTNTSLPHVVILGCGFGGLATARKLAHTPLRITMIDKSNHHLFQPLLYQVATAGLAAPAIAAPVRSLLADQANATTLMADVLAVDAARRVVTLDDGSELAYDWLVMATGTTHSYFGNDAWEPYAPGLKNLSDAFIIRKRILLAYEHAERELDAAKRVPWLTFAVIGAGPTGVELAGTLAEIGRHTLKHDFRRIDTRQVRVVLLEGNDRVLGTYPEDLSQKAREQLEHIGVEVHTGSRVTHIDAQGVKYQTAQGEQSIAVRTVVWAAGVAASPLAKTLGLPAEKYDRAGRVLVEPDLTAPGHAEIFVIGDLAGIQSDGKPVPGLGASAKQMGWCAAANLKRRLKGEATRPFHYDDYGTLSPIGRNAAVAVLGRFKLSGFIAWLIWLFAHIYFLIGFRNRVMVMMDWASAYFSFTRAARIVAGGDDPAPEDGA
ncbi:MAG TPA: NAD(P)/FAD-dependent oxidoreductase [Burkholderiales bacterium]|jgi:NADH dehydrogenase|nr:NAD(P)/FAD-dependent oxidoreductase [Burkholderiales bacterium]